MELVQVVRGRDLGSTGVRPPLPPLKAHTVNALYIFFAI